MDGIDESAKMRAGDAVSGRLLGLLEQ
jgi:hypothetical protein